MKTVVVDMRNPPPGSKVWKRLGAIELIPTARDDLDAVITGLEGLEPFTDHDRTIALWFLRRLRDSAKAMKAIEPRGRGRPIDSAAPWIALDYLAQKELLGKASAATRAVATAWSVAENTVEDAYTDWRKWAAHKLERLIKYKHGTRRALLEAVSLDIRDHRASGMANVDSDILRWRPPPSRKKSR